MRQQLFLIVVTFLALSIHDVVVSSVETPIATGGNGGNAVAEVKVSLPVAATEKLNVSSGKAIEVAVATTTTKVSERAPIVTVDDDGDGLSNGATLRAFYVVLGFSVCVLVYFAVKWYRVRSNKNQQPSMVRKYGVRTNRSDVEMVPLPLSEDDDDGDTTVFELNRSGR